MRRNATNRVTYFAYWIITILLTVVWGLSFYFAIRETIGKADWLFQFINAINEYSNLIVIILMLWSFGFITRQIHLALEANKIAPMHRWMDKFEEQLKQSQATYSIKSYFEDNQEYIFNFLHSCNSQLKISDRKQLVIFFDTILPDNVLSRFEQSTKEWSLKSGKYDQLNEPYSLLEVLSVCSLIFKSAKEVYPDIDKDFVSIFQQRINRIIMNDNLLSNEK